MVMQPWKSFPFVTLGLLFPSKRPLESEQLHKVMDVLVESMNCLLVCPLP